MTRMQEASCSIILKWLNSMSAKELMPEYGGAAANAVDQANAWLTSPGSPEYNAGRMVGTYAAPMAAGLLMAGAGAGLTGLGGALARVGIGAATGAGFGAATPVDNPEQNFWGQKAAQTGAGAATGLALSGVGEGARALFPGLPQRCRRCGMSV